jgi:hypothetical protein
MPEPPDLLDPVPDEDVPLPALEPLVDESRFRCVESVFESRPEDSSFPAPVVPVGAAAELRPSDEPPVPIPLLPVLPLAPRLVPLLIPAPALLPAPRPRRRSVRKPRPRCAPGLLLL